MLSGQSVAAIGYARYLGSQGFAQSTYSCPRFEDASVVRTQSACGWFRVRGSWLDRDASGDDPGFSFDAVTTAIGGQAADRRRPLPRRRARLGDRASSNDDANAPRSTATAISPPSR